MTTVGENGALHNKEQGVESILFGVSTVKQTIETYDLVIIGGGPAGLSAGVYAARANLRTLILEKGLPGGQMQNTLEVENYTGMQMILGPELSESMLAHADHLGVEFKMADVQRIDMHGNPKTLFTSEGEFKAKAVLIATGATPKKLGIPGEDRLSGRGVSWCAVCDGAFFKNKKIAVVGGGDSAIEEGTFLTKFGESVSVIHRRDKLRAQPILQERAFSSEKMDFIWNHKVVEILGENRVSGIRIQHVETGEEQEIEMHGVFIYVGFTPMTSFISHQEILDQDGYIITDEDMQTSIPGIFAAGDVRPKGLRQIITAASDGAIAAMTAYHYIESLADAEPANVTQSQA
ncbi:thioredoxin-disulfide reductase [Alicyclobacillus sp. SO9]|uniref:thioredoxin-disulfide reductase n=1 Tax=Alicyclobacillus sp. SO9 TaxID=2665646 RepID=UPI0018E756AE|nr:thioredoxin-disulfide reductase [Alicyclobacillus sp. SO9]QQE81596.1 thioredoxin-disulfide reductase [Alicyclobacillus sp. SO9]